jgi:hypothetical protein
VRDEDNYDKLTVPVCAFITFESDDGFGEALNYTKRTSWWANRNLEEDNQYTFLTLLGAQVSFKPSTEPTNIIWENRHIKGINYCARATTAFMITAIMLLISFTVIIVFK